MDLIDRINANYNNLSRVHKRIVDYITDNPDRACFQSLKDFSDSVNASPVTVLRCLDKLGINGFLDLKKELRAYTRQSVYPGKRLASALSGLNSTSECNEQTEGVNRGSAVYGNPSVNTPCGVLPAPPCGEPLESQM